MRTVIQRVKSASVSVDGQLVSKIGKGLLVLAAVAKGDTKKEVESMASKILTVKFWESDEGVKWKKNVQEIDGEVLCVSQFTLLASTKKGNKPDFRESAAAEQARELYQLFFDKVQSLYREDRVKNGKFQAMMDVELINDGPVGVDYVCEDEQVTIQIDRNPPPMDDPTSFKPEDGPTIKGKVHKTFELPASLLE